MSDIIVIIRILISCINLISVIFSSGRRRKELLLEIILIKNTKMVFFIIFIYLLITVTIIYTIRIILYVFISFGRISLNVSIIYGSQEIAIVILNAVCIIFGMFFTKNFIKTNNLFFSFKYLKLVLTFFSLNLLLYLFILNNKFTIKVKIFIKIILLDMLMVTLTLFNKILKNFKVFTEKTWLSWFSFQLVFNITNNSFTFLNKKSIKLVNIIAMVLILMLL